MTISMKTHRCSLLNTIFILYRRRISMTIIQIKLIINEGLYYFVIFSKYILWLIKSSVTAEDFDMVSVNVSIR